MDGEDTNFTLFNYVNEVNAEVEKLEDNITAVRKEVRSGWVKGWWLWDKDGNGMVSKKMWSAEAEGRGGAGSRVLGLQV